MRLSLDGKDQKSDNNSKIGVSNWCSFAWPMTFRMTKLPIDGFDGDLEEQETGDEAIGVE